MWSPKTRDDFTCSYKQGLLVHATAPEFTVVHQWQVGDLVIWDNRSTMHCATGYDSENDTREMWRTTLVKDRKSPPSNTPPPQPGSGVVRDSKLVMPEL